MSAADASSARGHDQTRAFRRDLGRLLGAMSLVSMLLAAVIGGLAVGRFGPFLVMGLAIYTGNTQPDLPAAGYPWAGVALGLLLLLLGGVRAHRKEAHGMFVLHLGATLLALLPLWQLYRLWQALPGMEWP